MNQCVNAGVNHSAFVEHIVKAVALVRPSASTTERSNSLHKLLIGNRRAVVKNSRAFKMLYIYQNSRTLKAIQSALPSSHNLPDLPFISRVIQGGAIVEDDDYLVTVCGDEHHIEEVHEIVDAVECIDDDCAGDVSQVRDATDASDPDFEHASPDSSDDVVVELDAACPSPTTKQMAEELLQQYR